MNGNLRRAGWLLTVLGLTVGFFLWIVPGYLMLVLGVFLLLASWGTLL